MYKLASGFPFYRQTVLGTDDNMHKLSGEEDSEMKSHLDFD